jgi:hypothetical protein
MLSIQLNIRLTMFCGFLKVPLVVKKQLIFPPDSVCFTEPSLLTLINEFQQIRFCLVSLGQVEVLL